MSLQLQLKSIFPNCKVVNIGCLVKVFQSNKCVKLEIMEMQGLLGLHEEQDRNARRSELVEYLETGTA